jgi:HEAT repeat protein
MGLNEIWTKYQILIVAIFTLIVAPLFWKIAGGLWSLLIRLGDRLGRLAGGRLSYRSFEKQYLNWVVTENKDLKLTGIVSYDEAKKPQLEQVFISLRLGKGEGKETEAKSIFCQARKNWWRRILLPLVFKIDKKVESTESPDWLTQVAKRIDNARKHRLRGWTVRFILGIGTCKATSDGLTHFRRVLRSSQYIAFLGGPGAGKTTLLQFIAIVFARQRAGDPKLRRPHILREQFDTKYWRLPIVVTIRTIAGTLSKDIPNTMDISLVDILIRTLPPDLQRICPPSYFKDQFKKGRCLLLLDGLDEVVSDEEFDAVVRAVRSLMVVYPESQFIVTSRPAGWRGGVGSEFEVLQVNELSDNEINQFIDSWYTAVERNAVVGPLESEGRTERLARERRAGVRATDLKEALNKNVSIRRLAQNPLLLSIIALVHRSLATLPRERAKLYSECTKILLEQWDVSRGVHVDDTNLKLAQKEAIMRRIACALHTGEIGEKVGGREASRDQIERLVAEMLPPMGQPPENAHRLLQRLIERSGLIAEQRRDVLIFAHLTFQEYFTAQALASGQIIVEEILSKNENLLSDWWREVILLYSGLISDASEFIERVYKPQKDIFFRPRLRLAGMCLAEAVEVKKAAVRQRIGRDLITIYTKGEVTTHNSSLAVELIEYLIEWSRNEIWYEYAGIAGIADLVSSEELFEHTLTQLTAALDRKEVDVRLAAIGILGLIGKKACRTSVVDRLIAALSSEVESVRLLAIHTLSKLNSETYTDRVVNSLIPLLEDEDIIIAFASAKALTTLIKNGSTDQKLIDSLWVAFNNLVHKQEAMTIEVKGILMRHILTVGDRLSFIRTIVMPPILVEERRRSFITDFDYYLDWQSYPLRSVMPYRYALYNNKYRSLSYLSHELAAPYWHNKEFELQQNVALETLESLELGEVNSNPAGWVLAILARKTGREDILDRFVVMLDGSDTNARIAAACALEVSGKGIATTKIANKLAELLYDKNPVIRRTAVAALGALGEKGGTALVIENLSLVLRDKDIWVRSTAAIALASLGGESTTSEAIAKVGLLLRDRNPAARFAAAYALGTLGHKTSTSQITEILSSALKARQSTLRASAAQVIAELGQKAAIPEVISSLLLRLEDKKASVRAASVKALGILGDKAATPEIVEKLLVLVEDPKWNVRKETISALGHLAKKERTLEIVDKLFFVLGNADREIQEATFEALGLLGETAARSHILEKLSKLLDDNDAFLREQSIQVIAKLGKEAITPLLRDRLFKALRDKSKDVQTAALKAIQTLESRLVDDQTISEIVPLLQEREVRKAAYKTLEDLNVKSGRWARKTAESS